MQRCSFFCLVTLVVFTALPVLAQFPEEAGDLEAAICEFDPTEWPEWEDLSEPESTESSSATFLAAKKRECKCACPQGWSEHEPTGDIEGEKFGCPKKKCKNCDGFFCRCKRTVETEEGPRRKYKKKSCRPKPKGCKPCPEPDDPTTTVLIQDCSEMNQCTEKMCRYLVNGVLDPSLSTKCEEND